MREKYEKLDFIKIKDLFLEGSVKITKRGYRRGENFQETHIW